MLPKNRRIPRKEFSHILHTGKRYNSSHFLVYSAFLEDSSAPSRFSFSVSKKIFKKAVDRNTYRRRGYAVVSSFIKDIRRGRYLFFSYKKGLYPVAFKDLKEEIAKLLCEARVL